MANRWRAKPKQTMVKNSKLFAISAGFKPFLLTACEHLRANSWDRGLTSIDARVLRSFGPTESNPRQDFKGFPDEGGGSDCQSEPTWLQRTIDACSEVNAGRNRERKRQSASTFSSVSAALPVQWTSIEIFASTQRENGANTYKKQQPRI